MLGLSDRQHLHALRWMCSAPALLSNAALIGALPSERGLSIHRWSTRDSAILAAWCERLDAATLAAALGPEPKPTEPGLRLGRYAERLVAFMLSHGPLHELIAAHVPLRIAPVMHDRTTSGELDFLLRDASGQHWHWELAVKLFLFDPPACAPLQDKDIEASHFVGPDRKDNLAAKLDKLVGRQLVQPIPAKFGSGPWQSALFAMGWMFYPIGKHRPQAALLEPHHPKGWWLDSSRQDELPEGDYLVLPRLRWLAPAILEPNDAVMSRRQLLAWFGTWQSAMSAKAQLIARIDRQSGFEIERYFVRPPPPP